MLSFLLRTEHAAGAISHLQLSMKTSFEKELTLYSANIVLEFTTGKKVKLLKEQVLLQNAEEEEFLPANLFGKARNRRLLAFC